MSDWGDDGLRDLLAQKFVKLFIDTLKEHRPPDGITAMYDFTPIADECLRQMEWVRVQYGRGEIWIGDGREGTRRLVDCSELPITLAPEDWKP